MREKAKRPPRVSSYVEKLLRISQLVAPEPTLMLLTSTNWGLLADEIWGQHKDSLADQTKRPSPSNFQRLIIGTLTVANSGTEDQDVVNIANQAAAEKAHFAFKRDQWQTERPFDYGKDEFLG